MAAHYLNALLTLLGAINNPEISTGTPTTFLRKTEWHYQALTIETLYKLPSAGRKSIFEKKLHAVNAESVLCFIGTERK